MVKRHRILFRDLTTALEAIAASLANKPASQADVELVLRARNVLRRAHRDFHSTTPEGTLQNAD